MEQLTCKQMTGKSSMSNLPDRDKRNLLIYLCKDDFYFRK